LLVGGVRTGLNISERLKTNDMRAYRKDGTSDILEKKFGCDMLFLSVLYAFKYGRKQSAF